MKIATTAVIQHNNKILLGKRQRDDRWELPGGKVDDNETPEQCVIREIKEELGIDIKIVKFLEELQGMYRDIPMQVFAFLTQYVSGEIVLNVHKEAHWVEPNEIQKYDIVEEDRLVLQRFMEGYYEKET